MAQRGLSGVGQSPDSIPQPHRTCDGAQLPSADARDSIPDSGSVGMVVDDLAGEVKRDRTCGAAVPRERVAAQASGEGGELVGGPVAGIEDGELGAGHGVPGGAQDSGLVSNVEAGLAVAVADGEVVGLVSTGAVDKVVGVRLGDRLSVQLGAGGNKPAGVVLNACDSGTHRLGKLLLVVA